MLENTNVYRVSVRFIIGVIIFSMLQQGYLWAHKKGSQVLVTKLDGEATEGELLKVEATSILLMTSGNRGVNIEIKEIDKIAVKKKKSKAVKGLLIGIGAGYLVGAILARPYAQLATDDDNPSFMVCFASGLLVGTACAIPGSLIGTTIGSMIPGKEYKVKEVIDVKGTAPEELGKILEKLKKKSRFK